MIKRFGCVIMASGLGRRFGGNKLLADFRGQPLITRAFAATDGIFDRRVVVTRYPQVARLCHQRGIAVPSLWQWCAIEMAQSCHYDVLII